MQPPEQPHIPPSRDLLPSAPLAPAAPAPMRSRDDFGLAAPAPPRELAEPLGVDSVSQILTNEARHIQDWAQDNLKDAQRDRLHFWMLKIPAIFGGLGASALESFGHGTAVIVLGFVTAVCVAIDGLYPRGRLYNVHKRAANELLALQDSLGTNWNQAQLQTSDSEVQRHLMAKMLEEVKNEKRRINKYITDAEASLGEQGRAAGG